MRWQARPGRSPEWSTTEVEFLGEHGHHAGDLLLLMEVWVVRLRLEVPGYPVIHPGKDLHDLQLLAMLVQDGAERLHEPRAPARVPPRVVTFKGRERSVSATVATACCTQCQWREGRGVCVYRGGLSLLCNKNFGELVPAAA